MSNSEIALRILLKLARHPATQAFAKHVARQATAALIRTVRNRSKRGAYL